jgi:error-prone DNA polymerase
MTRGLAEKDGNALVAARGTRPYQSTPALARRAGAGTGVLVRLAKADAFASLGLSRRQASRAIKGLRDEALPLFEAAEQRAQEIVPEQIEEVVSLHAMTRGREVVEDYCSHGLSLRPHPLAFLRSELASLEISPCEALSAAKDGSRITVSGLVMVRQRPGSAKGVMFITLEDETDIANLIIWPSLFDKQRRVILGARRCSPAGARCRRQTASFMSWPSI